MRVKSSLGMVPLNLWIVKLTLSIVPASLLMVKIGRRIVPVSQSKDKKYLDDQKTAENIDIRAVVTVVGCGIFHKFHLKRHNFTLKILR